MASSSFTANVTCSEGSNAIWIDQSCFCNYELNAFFDHRSEIVNDCCKCESKWIDDFESSIMLSVVFFLSAWSIVCLVFLFSLRNRSRNLMLIRLNLLLSVCRIVYWIDPRGIRGFMNGHVQLCVHYFGLVVSLTIFGELLREWNNSLISIRASTYKRALVIGAFVKYYSLGCGVVFLVLFVVGEILMFMSGENFGTWYALVLVSWPLLYSIATLIISIVTLYVTMSLYNKFTDQHRRVRRATRVFKQKELNPDGGSVKKMKQASFRSRSATKSHKSRHASMKLNVLPPHIILNNKALMCLAGLQTVGTAFYLATVNSGSEGASISSRDGNQSASLYYILRFSSIDLVLVVISCWSYLHLIGLKYLQKRCCVGKAAEAAEIELHEGGKSKRHVSGSAKRLPQQGNRKLSGIPKDSAKKRGTGKDEKAQKTSSSIECMSPENINEKNFDKMLDLVVTKALQDVGEGAGGYGSLDDGSDVSSYGSSDDDSEVEEYSFDVVKRVALSQSRRVSLYEMQLEFKDDGDGEEDA
jgi:hypothetical protein